MLSEARISCFPELSNHITRYLEFDDIQNLAIADGDVYYNAFEYVTKNEVASIAMQSFNELSVKVCYETLDLPVLEEPNNFWYSI